MNFLKPGFIFAYFADIFFKILSSEPGKSIFLFDFIS